ncbi:MAG: ATPase, T2SS/T4P/T4SS family [Victivallaceae bacterium]
MKIPDKLEPYEIVDLILRETVKLGASDIYWLPEEDDCRICCRVGGVQKPLHQLDNIKGLQCITRIKVMANLLTYRNQVAQDGVIKDGEKFPGVEFRVAVMPTVNGERITLRILDKAQSPQFLDELNFAPGAAEQLKAMLKPSGGMIVLTGPTGCGKTTTIYAMIRELIKNKQDPASIISIEDPVESRIPGISQVSLSKSNEQWNYAQALRAALRQDVKTLIIGEMRDAEIIKVALDAALTGHRVITTFHAGDIPAVYTRILHHGFEPFLVASAITGIVSQRLLKAKSGDRQIPLAALLIPDDNWRDFIIDNPALSEIRKHIIRYPQADLHNVAAKMAEKGLIEEKDVYLL